MPLFRERLWAAPWLYVACALVVPAVIVVFAPVDPPNGVWWGVALGVAIYLAVVAYLLIAAPVLEVTDASFRAGRARIGREHLGRAEAFTGGEAALERGQRLDARAWLLLRGGLPVVKVEVTDPADPAPYWLVSTRRPNELASVLNTKKGPED